MEWRPVKSPHLLCNIYRDKRIHVDMERGVFTCDHERRSTGNSGKAVKLLLKNFPHVSSWPQSPEAHRASGEVHLPSCHALPLFWWSVRHFLHFLNTLSSGCWSQYPEMVKKSNISRNAREDWHTWVLWYHVWRRYLNTCLHERFVANCLCWALTPAC